MGPPTAGGLLQELDEAREALVDPSQCVDRLRQRHFPLRPLERDDPDPLLGQLQVLALGTQGESRANVEGSSRVGAKA